MDNESVLQIVLKAKDEATAVLNKAAAEVTAMGDSHAQAMEKVEDSTDKAAESTSYFADHIQDIGIAAGGILGTLAAVGKSMLDVAATMEQNKIAFDTMIGSASLAGKTLQQLSDFAAKTPFELPEVVEGSKQLLAFGVSADKLIPTFKTLGDIASGVGREKMPDLIHAFGQVAAGTKLTGRELNEFTMAGVPLLQTLVDQYNKGLIPAVAAAGVVHKNTKIDIEHVNAEIAIANRTMVEHKEKYADGTLAHMKMEEHLRLLNGQLSKASETTTTFTGSAKVNAEQMKKMIEDGSIGFDTVQKALTGMTDKGGRFFDLMDKQSHSFSGIVSNMQDNLTRLSMQIMGMSETGDIRQGSMFYYIRIGAEKLLSVMDDLRPKLVRLADDLLHNKTVVIGVAGALGGLAIAAIAAAVAFAGPAIAGALAFAAAGAAIAVVIETITTHLNQMLPQLAAVGAGLVVIGLTNPFTALLIGAGALAAGFFYLSTQTDFLKTKNDLLKDSNDRLTQAQDRLKGSTDGLTDAQARLKDMQVQLEGASLMVQHAQDNLDRMQRIYGQGSYEVREARQQVAEAELNAERTMRETTRAMQDADKAKASFIESSKAVAKAQDDVTAKTNLQASAWDTVVSSIGSAISKLGEWNDKVKKATGGIGLTVPGVHLPGFAEGTNFAPGGWAVVGERGPELAYLPRGSQVVPNNRTEQNFNGGNVSIGTVNVRSENDIQTLAQQMAFYRKTRGNL